MNGLPRRVALNSRVLQSMRRAQSTTIVYASNPRSENESNGNNGLSKRWHGNHHHHDENVTRVPVSFIKSGNIINTEGREGESLLQTAHRYPDDVALEGACEGVCACSTCHVILSEEFYEDLLDKQGDLSEEEEDMLDMAYALTSTSRLACQIKVTPDIAGQEIRVPNATRNFYVDGHVPKPH
mmetsp:Transcript_1368/g.1946  ORF Transcript_1368/g.1946 Transcript_1368/m.1946 type:complete len:183 (-) Transcript_1368:26-574(-)